MFAAVSTLSIAGIVLGILGMVGALVAATLWAIGSRNRTLAEQQDLSLNAMNTRLEAQKDEIAELRDDNKVLREELAEARGAIKALSDLVTARDMIHRGFLALGVTEDQLTGAR